MTRPITTTRIEKEARLQQAITAFKSKQKTASQAIRDFNVPRQTFYDRLNGKPPRKLAREKVQLLTHIQEKELVRRITRPSITGHPPQHNTCEAKIVI